MSPRSNLQAALAALIGDKYEVERWIGGGGMAEVFLTRRRAHGGRFAVKVLAEHLAGDAKVVARFLAEARTAVALSGHPNIAPIFDVGEGGGVYYLIMPYVEGEDVSRYLERHGRLSEAETVCIVEQVAEALVWAADRKVVHRDLKPSNIRIDRSGRVVVLDFGIAKAGDVPSALTTQGETPGTPYYMSPEQIRGEPCEPPSDLYSLGVVFFELLTGRRPFEGDSPRAIETAHLNQAPPALGAVVPVDPQLEQIVLRLLQKDPRNRYGSARELLAELASVAARLPEVHLVAQIDDVSPDEVPAGPSHIDIRPRGAAAVAKPKRKRIRLRPLAP
jgi:serine/threonine-protein kinase